MMKLGLLDWAVKVQGSGRCKFRQLSQDFTNRGWFISCRRRSRAAQMLRQSGQHFAEVTSQEPRLRVLLVMWAFRSFFCMGKAKEPFHRFNNTGRLWDPRDGLWECVSARLTNRSLKNGCQSLW